MLAILGLVAQSASASALIEPAPASVSSAATFTADATYQIGMKWQGREWLGTVEFKPASGGSTGVLCMVPLRRSSREELPNDVLRSEVRVQDVRPGVVRLVSSRGPLAFSAFYAIAKSGPDEPLTGWHYATASWLPLDVSSRPAGTPDYILQLPTSEIDRARTSQFNRGRFYNAILRYTGTKHSEYLSYARYWSGEIPRRFGIIGAVIDSNEVAKISSYLEGLGDGAQLLNPNLAGCGANTFATYVEVPTVFEPWYVARLAKDKVAIAVYPITSVPDNEPSDLFVADDQVSKDFDNFRTVLDNKQALLKSYISESMLEFVQARRPTEIAAARATVEPGRLTNSWRATIRGVALSTCSKHEPEVVEVQFSYSGSYRLRGDADTRPAIRIDSVRVQNDAGKGAPKSAVDGFTATLTKYLAAKRFKAVPEAVPAPSLDVRCA